MKITKKNKLKKIKEINKKKWIAIKSNPIRWAEYRRKKNIQQRLWLDKKKLQTIQS